MPRKFKLNWDKKLKYWYKKIDGKKKYFGKAKSKYLDNEGYKRAEEKYEDFLKSSEYSVIKSKKTHDSTVIASEYSGRHGKRAATTVARALDDYFQLKQSDFNQKKITLNRLHMIKNVLTRFESWMGKGKNTRTFELGGSKKYLTHKETTNYFIYLERLVKEGQWVPETAHAHWCVFKDFLHYSYEKHYIDEVPRNIHRQTFVSRIRKRERKPIKTYSVKQIRELYTYARNRMMLPYECWIALALNCGFNASDIGTLTYDNLVWKDDEIIRIKKTRTKTNQYGEWKLWNVTNKLLKRYLNKSKEFEYSKIQKPHQIFFDRTGRPVWEDRPRTSNDQSKNNMGNLKGYHTNSIGRQFTLALKTHFPELSGTSFKTLRKTGVSEIVKLHLPNTLLIEQLYLAHKPTSMARMYYSKIDADTLDDAIDKLEDVFRLDELFEEEDTKNERRRQAYNARKKRERDARRNRRTHGTK